MQVEVEDSFVDLVPELYVVVGSGSVTQMSAFITMRHVPFYLPSQLTSPHMTQTFTFMCMNVLPAFICARMQYQKRPGEGIRFPELELQAVVRY